MYNTLFFTAYEISEGLSAITRLHTCKPSHSRNKQVAKFPEADLLFFCPLVARRLVLAAAANVMQPVET